MSTTGTNIKTQFKIGDKVKIIPFGEIEGRVVSIWLNKDGLRIEVRYTKDVSMERDYFYEDELEFTTEKKTGF